MAGGDSTNWIWIPEWEKEEQTIAHLVFFRKDFVLPEGFAAVRIRISADSRYKLYVNGRLAEIGPCKGDRMVWYYDVLTGRCRGEKRRECLLRDFGVP